MSDKHLEYSLNELPDMMELGVRQNMLSTKHKDLWPNAVSKFKKSIDELNPLNGYIHKNMNTAKISKHVNKTPIFESVSPELEEEYVDDWHISDGHIQLPMGAPSMWGIKVLDEWSKRDSLKQYEPYFEPTGRISDFAFLNTTNPIGLKFDTGMVETCQLVYKEQILDEDLSCINFIVDIGKGSNVTLEEFIAPKINGCKIIKITYLVRQGAKLEILRTATPGNSSLTVIDSKFICFPESDVIVQTKGKGSHYTQEFFDFDIYRSSQVCLDGRYNIKNEDNNHIGVLVNHLENDSISDIDIKTVVDGDSNSSFIGNIFVDKIARGTDAKLFNKNLLLSNKATAISEPQLDINTKDIECSHGCTVSNIDPQQLYLLNARGLDSQSARNTLKECFLNQ
tara:strand:- start:1579 stop:2766 length:1188 start_codon:yes stop_codon:yes gene_type:complete